MCKKMDARNYCKFEEIIAKIFNEAGYTVTRNQSKEYDFIAEMDNKKYYVEIKFSQITEKTVSQYYFKIASNDIKLVLVSAFEINDTRRRYYQSKYSNLILVDIANLMYAVKNDTELYNGLIALLPYSIDDIEPQKGPIPINYLKHEDYTKSLINEMNMCEAGKPMARTYEELCHKLLENIFSEDLALWREQQKSNNELYKFDLLCRIKDGNQKTFWSILERFFNSKYVIFEFKNYNDPITQKEIYTTERYLYLKALRGVGIIISAHGYDKNAYWAAKGCLRENGKLIMLLETKDLIEMNKMKVDMEDPSSFLLEKLDEILLDLEK